MHYKLGSQPMEKDCNLVWQNCLKIIAKEISPQSFQTWFSPIKPMKLENGVLTISVPSPFFYEWIEEHYVHLLKKAINTEIGPEGKLEYAIVMDRPQHAPLGNRNLFVQKNPQQRPFTEENRNQQTSAAPQQGYGQHPQQGSGMSQFNQNVQGQPYNTQQQVPTYQENNRYPQQQPQQGGNQFQQPQRPTNYPQQQNKPQQQQAVQNQGQSFGNGYNNQSDYTPSGFQHVRHSNLRADYLFDNYVVGDCNRFAVAAGKNITQDLGKSSFNPLVIHGGVGLGKTHLAQAIGHEIKKVYPDKFVLYVSTEQFMNQFIEAMGNKGIQSFINYYLQVDALIIDDIQFLGGKEKIQEIFFQIFNRLHQNLKPIIMTSDRPPVSLEGLTDRLLSRFKWGLTVDIKTPDFETRVAIVQKKLQSEGNNIPYDVVEYLAYNIDSNIRELEGALHNLLANAQLMQQEIDINMAKAVLLNIVRTTEREITIELIQQIVADYFNISVDELKSKTRKKDIANARQIAMYFSKEYTKEPLKEIGKHFGGRDHSTVVHASKAVSKKMESDALYERILEELVKQMNLPS